MTTQHIACSHLIVKLVKLRLTFDRNANITHLTEPNQVHDVKRTVGGSGGVTEHQWVFTDLM